MTTSAGAAVLDYLFTTISQKITPTDGSLQVYVSDGPPVTADAQAFSQRIAVGHNVADPAAQAVESEQDFAALNQARSRYEVLTVTLSAETWTGDTSAVKTCRDNLYSLVGQVELLLRGSPTATGGPGPGDASLGGAVMYSQILRTQYHQAQDENGFSALMIFDIQAKARLVT